MNHVWTKGTKRTRYTTGQSCASCGLVRLTVQRHNLPGWWAKYFTPNGKALGFARPSCPGEIYVVCW